MRTLFMISLARVESLAPVAEHKWGRNAQLIKTVEELAELQVQVCKVLNGSPTTVENVVDEIADVLVMAAQLRHFYGASKVDERMEYKLDRLEKALSKPKETVG